MLSLSCALWDPACAGPVTLDVLYPAAGKWLFGVRIEAPSMSPEQKEAELASLQLRFALHGCASHCSWHGSCRAMGEAAQLYAIRWLVATPDHTPADTTWSSSVTGRPLYCTQCFMSRPFPHVRPPFLVLALGPHLYADCCKSCGNVCLASSPAATATATAPTAATTAPWCCRQSGGTCWQCTPSSSPMPQPPSLLPGPSTTK